MTYLLKNLLLSLLFHLIISKYLRTCILLKNWCQLSINITHHDHPIIRKHFIVNVIFFDSTKSVSSIDVVKLIQILRIKIYFQIVHDVSLKFQVL